MIGTLTDNFHLLIFTSSCDLVRDLYDLAHDLLLIFTSSCGLAHVHVALLMWPCSCACGLAHVALHMCMWPCSCACGLAHVHVALLM